jgi:hypothetical protein
VIPPRKQPVEEVCHVNGVAVQRYLGLDQERTTLDKYGVPLEVEMVTLFYSGGAKIDMSLAAFDYIVKKWLAYVAGKVES